MGVLELWNDRLHSRMIYWTILIIVPSNINIYVFLLEWLVSPDHCSNLLLGRLKSASHLFPEVKLGNWPGEGGPCHSLCRILLNHPLLIPDPSKLGQVPMSSEFFLVQSFQRVNLHCPVRMDQGSS